MSRPPWTERDIRELISGTFVALYGEDTAPRPMPAWMQDLALGDANEGRDTGVHPSTHSEDRWRVGQAFRTAQRNPGCIERLTTRMMVRGEWMAVDLAIVNLLDHPLVGAVLTCSSPGRPATAPDEVEPVNGGEHDAKPWILARTDVSATVLEVEGKVRELTGRSPEEIVGLTPLELMHPDSSDDSVAMWWALIGQPGATATSRRCFLHPDGTEVWAECTYLNRLGDPTKGDVLMMAHDITERRAQEQALQESHEQVRRLAEESQALADQSHALAEDFRLLADEVPAAVFRCDRDGTITFHNTRWDELLPGRRLTRVQDAVHPSVRERLGEALDRLVNGEGADRTTLELPSAAAGRVFAVTCRSDNHEEPARRRIIGSIEDVTTTVRLRREASHDKLTGLVNRKGLEERLAVALEEDPEGTLLVFFDLDGFKTVNDVHGHDAGDVVLQELGARLARAVRPTDTISRYGGDEFVLVCSAVGDAGAAAIVERLRLVLDLPIVFDGGSWEPSASIGTARAEAGDDAAAVIRRADLNMFEAKRTHYENQRPSRR